MSAQTITTPNGERLVVLSEADYRALLDAAENSADVAAVRDFRLMLEAGEEELLPSEFVDRILNGENPVRVWRELRKMTSSALAEAAGVGQGYLSQIETGKREGTIETMKKISKALNVTLDDLVG
jgi:DNA-binding XRE family transcriptional regulator